MRQMRQQFVAVEETGFHDCEMYFCLVIVILVTHSYVIV